MLRASGRAASIRPTLPLLRAAGALALAGALLVFPGRPAASETAPVEPGSALATSELMRVDVIYGKFAFPFGSGISRAYYQADEASASSHGVNLGVLNGGSGAGCPSPAAAAAEEDPGPNQQPPFTPLVLGSRDGEKSETYGSQPLVSGEVSVDPSPLAASARSSAVALDIPGLIKITGQSTAAVAYEQDKQRTAHATASADITLVGGVVRLGGLTWDARHLTGTKADATAGFSLASVTVAGQHQPVGTDKQLSDAIKTANATLRQIGISIELPQATDRKGTVAVSGLVIRILGNDALAAIVVPLFELKAPVQDLITEILNAPGDCNLQQLSSLVGTAELVGDVVLGGLAGEGGIDLTIGGVSAGSAAPPEYEDPFGNGKPPTSGGVPPVKPPVNTGTGGVVDAPDPGTVVTGETPAVAQPTIGATYTVGCVSTNTFDTDPCSSGSGALLFGGLLAGALALFAADLYQSRRPRPIVRRSVS